MMPSWTKGMSLFDRQFLFNSAADDIKSSGCVTTSALVKILRATARTDIKFCDGSSAIVVPRLRKVVYISVTGHIKAETFNALGLARKR